MDKPPIITSHGVVGACRRALGTRKVGHAGTLDPMATGVLVLGVNRATRLLGHLMLTQKSYQATVRLGVSTNTDDADGEVTATHDASAVTAEQIEEGLAPMHGEIEQVPAAVSAIKVDGKRAYKRVRDGEDVQLPARSVTVHELEFTEVRREGQRVDVDIRLRCSSGTYVRAIARDLGESLGVGGHLTMLRRTAVGPFAIADAVRLDEVEPGVLVPLSEVARRCFPVRHLTAEEAVDVRYGRALAAGDQGNGATALIDPQGEFLALYEKRDQKAKALAVFVG